MNQMYLQVRETSVNFLMNQYLHNILKHYSMKKQRIGTNSSHQSDVYLFYFILFYFILFYFILFYFILFYFILFPFIFFFLHCYLLRFHRYCHKDDNRSSWGYRHVWRKWLNIWQSRVDYNHRCDSCTSCDSYFHHNVNLVHKKVLFIIVHNIWDSGVQSKKIVPSSPPKRWV